MIPGRRLEKAEKGLLGLIQYEGDDQGHEWPTRLLLWWLHKASTAYCTVVQLRLMLFEHGILRRYPLGSQVISVGNVTVGGTGKTPMVEALARELQANGRRVAILSRGYRRKERTWRQRLRDRLSWRRPPPPLVVSDGRRLLVDSEHSGDEPYMLAGNLENVVVLVDKNRVKSGRYAVHKFGCDMLLLDDGFQYQRLKHRHDLVLVDCGNPFGNGRVLPRGILREPVRNLSRAKFVCLTKVNGRDTTALRERILALNPRAVLMECDHMPRVLRHAFTGAEKPLEMLRGLRIVALSGIASPQSFEGSLEKLGAELLGRERFADHHRFTQQEVIDLVNRAAERGADAVLTTEKDAVRMPRVDRCSIPVYYLRIEVCFQGGSEQFERCIQEIICEEEEPGH